MANGIEALEIQVAIDAGWQLQGGASVTLLPRKLEPADYFLYAQAIVREKPDEPAEVWYEDLREPKKV